MHRNTPRLLAGALVLAILAGCGGGDDSPGQAAATDSTAPTLTLTSDALGTTAVGPVTLTFAFDEDVGSSFTAEDIAVTNATKSALTKVDSTHYTIVLTPAANARASMQVSVAAASYSDAAGNAGAAAALEQAFDTVTAPALVELVRAYVSDAEPAYDTATSKALPGNHTTGTYSANAGEQWWWGGTAADQLFVGYGVSATVADQWGFGMFIRNGGSGWDIPASTSFHALMGTNAECAGTCRVTVKLVSVADAACTASAKVALSAAALTAYTVPLSSFTVSGCTTDTIPAFKLLKVGEVHFQMLRADMQFATTTDATLYPNGLNMGGDIRFD